MQFQNAPITSEIVPSGDIKEKRHRVFWFKKEGGEPFCTQEEEAWNILSGRIKIFDGGRETTKRHQYLGASDSTAYFGGLKEMSVIFKEHGIEKAREFLHELEKKELESADKHIRPRNFDRTNTEGIPVDGEGLPVRF
jgi:hypothetical protein